MVYFFERQCETTRTNNVQSYRHARTYDGQPLTIHIQFALDNPTTLSFDLLTSGSVLAEGLSLLWTIGLTTLTFSFYSADRETDIPRDKQTFRRD